MGWNDRLPEDPYWPDQDSYIRALECHNELLRAELEVPPQNGPGLSSQNINPGEQVPPLPPPTEEADRRAAIGRFLAKFRGAKQ